MGVSKRSKFQFLKATMVVLSLGMVMAYAGAAQAAPQYSLNCASCHTMPPRDSVTAKKDPSNGAVPGNHQTHAKPASVNDKGSCVMCHGPGVTGYDNSHRNKRIEFVDALGYGRNAGSPVFMNQTSVPPSPLTSCATAVCHSDGKGNKKTTPAWGSSAIDCSTCHDATPITGTHTKHVATYSFSCDKCHADHAAEPVASRFQHATSAGKRNIDVHFTTAPNSGGTFLSAQCSNLYCHSNGKGVSVDSLWGGSADCKSCHDNAGDTTNASKLSGKHNSHVNNAAILGTNFGCVECHSATVSNNTTILDKAKHVNGSVQLAGARFGTTTDATCATNTCHTDGKGGRKTVDWATGAAIGCDGCHGTSATFGAPAYVTDPLIPATANSHAKHATSSETCVNCHSKTTTTGTAIIAGSQHTDGFINFTSGNGKTFGKQANKTCSDISCHSGNGIVKNVSAAQWGVALSCAGCHGDTTNTAKLTPAHVKHIAKGISCAVCHEGTAANNTTLVTGGGLHANAAKDVTFGVGKLITAFNPADSSCTVSCHKASTPKWTDTLTGACGSCHSVTTVFSTGFSAVNAPLHESHYTSIKGPKINSTWPDGCQTCHVYTTDTAATHANNTVNLLPGFGTSASTCGTCHAQAATTNWALNAKVSCESCHSTAGGTLSVINNKTAPDKTTAATSGHGKGSINQACTVCHNNNSAHIGVVGGTKRLFNNYTTTTAGAGCNDCHNTAAITNPLMKNMKVHQASGLGSTCADCHNPHGTANIMMVNETINGITVDFKGNDKFVNATQTGVCQVCHSGGVKTSHFNNDKTTPQTEHVASTSVNCLDCHLHNPKSGERAFVPNGGCDTCHGYPPAPRNVSIEFGKHNQWSSARFEDYSGGGGAHLVGGHIPATAKASEGWINCITCHSGETATHARVLPLRDNVQRVTVLVDPKLRFSDTALITYTSAKLVSGGANKTGSCFNVSCHFQTTQKWSIER